MLDTLFQGLLDTALTDPIAPGDFLLCVGTSLLLGLLLAVLVFGVYGAGYVGAAFLYTQF